MAPATIKITYDLKPPASINAGDQATAKTHIFEVKPSCDGNTAFYTALRRSLDTARNQVGDELTTWRDLVGKAELSKELKKVADNEEEEEEEEEEEA
ncbi:hypothetical protein BDZ97DRAFT_1785578 [Flammula alnicola]|nr:hypothetical protein BDZ97DRAFT_1785578 [Flammula alnicola]